uniref:Uncharacterized protein n=1 Tax=Tanacetum cinerariifolium TaxID=118510 RepID=A0A699H026_TANCI|nr:hypothetical protein [Tanacetum cinerariifolium]
MLWKKPVHRIGFIEYAILVGRIDTLFRLQHQYAVLDRRFDTPHPTGGYVISGSVPGQDVASRLKKTQEKDKIGSKPDKNEKRGEAGKSQKQLQWIKREILKKMQKEGPEMQTHASFIERKKIEGLFLQFDESYNVKDQSCLHIKDVTSKDLSCNSLNT